MPALSAMSIVSSGVKAMAVGIRETADDDLVDEAGRHAGERRRSRILRKDRNDGQAGPEQQRPQDDSAQPDLAHLGDS